MFNNFFLKIVSYINVEKHGTARQVREENKIRRQKYAIFAHYN
jgi:hypothetical protein